MADEPAKFEKWMARPLEEIEARSADSAFIVLMASFAMWERLVKSRMRAEKDALGIRRMDEGQKKEFFYELSADMLGIADVQLFKNFWHIYRDGLAHYFMPMDKGMDAKEYNWSISADYGDLPEYHGDPATVRTIRVNPWRWTRRVVKEWRARPGLLAELQHVPFAEVSVTDV